MNLNATILGQIISFAFFVFFCTKYVWPPITSVIEKRQRDVKNSLKDTEKAKIELCSIQENIKKELKKSKEEAMLIIKKAHIRRKKILQKTKIEVEKERTNIIKKAKIAIDVERKKVMNETRQYTVQLAIQIAEKILERTIDKNDNDDLLKKLVSDL